MSAKLALFIAFACQALWSSAQGKCLFGVGQRILGDQLLLKDAQHSRPASSNEPPSIVFNYEIPEPITYIEIASEENISAEVRFSYVNQLVVGMVTVFNSSSPASFDVLITIYGYNQTMLNVNPALLINRDQQFEGLLEPDDGADYVIDSDELVEPYANAERDELQVDIDEGADMHEHDEDEHDDNGHDIDEHLNGNGNGEFEAKDKFIEVGHRQEGDYLIYETYQTSPNMVQVVANHTVVFYYIDSDFITYVKFVLFDHFAERQQTSADYLAPVAEYSHYSPNTLKAVITDFNASSLFVQMFVYGYKANEVSKKYVPFLPPPHWQRPQRPEGLLTPLQRLQLLMLTGKATVPPLDDNDVDGSDDKPATASLADIEGEAVPMYIDRSVPDTQNAALEQLNGRLGVWAMLGMLLLLMHN